MTIPPGASGAGPAKKSSGPASVGLDDHTTVAPLGSPDRVVTAMPTQACANGWRWLQRAVKH